MGEVSPKDGNKESPKKKRRSQTSINRYLKPGALAQLCYNKVSCTNIGKKRIDVFRSKKIEKEDHFIENKVINQRVVNQSPLMLSPVDTIKQSHLARTPKTPQIDDCESDSRLESLPIDLLVEILCHLHHDQLKAVFYVSQRIRKAVVIARQFHFNYRTPDRSRQQMLRTMTPLPTKHWPFISKGTLLPSPHTPKAPKHGPRPPSRIKATDMKQIAAFLFQDSAFPSSCIVPFDLSKPLCKSIASNMVLFFEDELCQVVAQLIYSLYIYMLCSSFVYSLLLIPIGSSRF